MLNGYETSVRLNHISTDLYSEGERVRYFCDLPTYTSYGHKQSTTHSIFQIQRYTYRFKVLPLIPVVYRRVPHSTVQE